MPETYHIAQEIQKYNIPDYRPRQEQYVLCIRLHMSVLLINLFFQVPKSDQEGPCSPANAT